MDDKYYTSRRKACEACVRSKRRCDMRFPCGRCIQRKLDCEYPRTSCSSEEGSEDFDESSLENSLVNSIDIGAFFAKTTRIPFYDSVATVVSFKMSRSALNFCTQKIGACSSSMARSGETPFIKATLSKLLASSALHDAFAVSAAYTSRTPQNESLIHALVIAKTNDLLSQQPWSFSDHLASAQALLLLHIIALFDTTAGPTSLRMTANQTFDPVRHRIMTLLQHQGTDLPPSIASNAYLKWVFLESVRRTYLTYIFVEAVYANLKHGYCKLVPLLATLPISLDGELWTAESEDEWMDRCAGMPMVLPYGEAVMVWQERVKEKKALESLLSMLRVACKGDSPIGEVLGVDGRPFLGPTVAVA